MTKVEFLTIDATRYVETLERELTHSAAQNAYHALTRLHDLGALGSELKLRYEIACDEVYGLAYGDLEG